MPYVCLGLGQGLRGTRPFSFPLFKNAPRVHIIVYIPFIVIALVLQLS